VTSTAADPLPSWNDGHAKEATLAYVARVTKEGSPDFVPEPERIAVFDNDGTLWPENPMPFQAAFAFDELKRRVVTEPELASDPMVRAALDGDLAKLLAGEHLDGVLRVLALTHAGMTTDAFRDAVESWLASARHPRFGLIVHHTDEEREYAYDADPKSTGKLVAALEEAPRSGWLVVDMKRDWNAVFAAT
jgi:hypothetical protein